MSDSKPKLDRSSQVGQRRPASDIWLGFEFGYGIRICFSRIRRLASLDLTWLHVTSLDFTWFDFTWLHLTSLDFTSFDFTWLHLTSLDFTWFHLTSLDFNWLQLMVIQMMLIMMMLNMMICFSLPALTSLQFARLPSKCSFSKISDALDSCGLDKKSKNRSTQS